MAQPTIRDSEEADLHLLATQLIATQNDHVEAFPRVYRPVSEPTAIEFLKSRLASTQAHVRVAEDQGSFAGYSFYEIRKVPESEFTLPRTFVYLNQISVVRAHRRKGIGSALVLDLKEISTELGIPRIELDVWAFNESARKFFLRHGFDLFGTKMALDYHDA